VDGFRLDAIPYLVESGDTLSGSSGTHAMLREYASFIHGIAPAAYTVGEVWDSVGAMLPYYPDQLDSHFAFELSDAIINAVRTGSAKNLLQGYLRLQRALPPERWSPFLRNHDQTRTMTELGGDIPRAKLAATLLLTLPGLPFVYYGEEIGMTGNKPDERLRTPMQWSRAPGVGFTTGKPWEAPQADSLTVNVESQQRDSSSLLNLYQRLIHLRAENRALGSGTLASMSASSDAVAAYVRREGDRTVLVVANLSDAPFTGVNLASDVAVLAPGQYAARSLLGGSPVWRLSVTSSGTTRTRLELPLLRAKQAYLLELKRLGHNVE
jgi:glycosidase